MSTHYEKCKSLMGGKKDKTGICGTHLAHDLSLAALLAEKGVILGGGLLSSKISIWTHYRLWLQLRPPWAEAEPLGAKAVKESKRLEEKSEWCYIAQSTR